MNVLICATQVPFARGGAEIHVEGLRDALVAAGHRADIVALPFKWYPSSEILKTALAWRMLDLTEANGVPVELVICTKFPTWAVRHPRKIAWIIHQHRQAYDWYGTPMSDLSASAEDRAVRRRIMEVDRRGLGECLALYSNSANVAGRLKRSIGLEATPLHVPVRLQGLAPVAYEPFVLSLSRLDRAKRVDLLLRALATSRRPHRAVIAGEGPEAGPLRDLARRLGLDSRVAFVGRVSDADAVELYNRARCVYYAPLDEDFGLATVEALTAGKPVLTAADSGGVLELVADDVSGVVAWAPEPGALASGLDQLMGDEALARRLGMTGRERALAIRWERVVETLLSHV